MGTLPTELFGLTSLTRSFILPYNYRLSGTLPTQVGQLSRLTGAFGVAGSPLSGTLPPQVGRLSDLSTSFVVQYTRLSGTIPGAVANIQKIGPKFGETGRAVSVGSFMLDYNRFTGPAPLGLTDMGAAYPIGMNFNQLTWVPPSNLQWDYYVPLCDELYRTPEDETDWGDGVVL